MANTTTVNGKFVTITGLDADWIWSTELPAFLLSGLEVKSIAFTPSAANDIMIVHEAGIDGAEIFRSKAASVETVVRYYFGLSNRGKLMKPVIDITDCTLSSAANAKVTLELG